ncbi:MAG TPA: hypothetical protein VMQ76_06495, partial [Terracidiphilus sp.]|nr:hypothetical protein [Terracidiphilus sp.]
MTLKSVVVDQTVVSLGLQILLDLYKFLIISRLVSIVVLFFVLCSGKSLVDSFLKFLGALYQSTDKTVAKLFRQD